MNEQQRDQNVGRAMRGDANPRGRGRGRGRGRNGSNRGRATTMMSGQSRTENERRQQHQQESITTDNHHPRRNRIEGDSNNKTNGSRQAQEGCGGVSHGGRLGGKQKQQQQNSYPRRNIMLLHGSRQTGQILLGRIDKLRKRLEDEYNIGLVAPDAPFDFVDDDNDNNNITTTANDIDLQINDDNKRIERTWWQHNYESNSKNDWYCGYETSIRQLYTLWNEYEQSHQPFIGLIGFSQGAQLAHFLTAYSENSTNTTTSNMFKGIQFAILVSVPSYSTTIPPPPLPILSSTEALHSDSPLFITDPTIHSIPTLHVWGTNDKLVIPEDSHAVMGQYFINSSIVECHIHEGGHIVPMKEPNVNAILNFIQKYHANASSVDTCVNSQETRTGSMQMAKSSLAGDVLSQQVFVQPHTPVEILSQGEDVHLVKEEQQPQSRTLPTDIIPDDENAQAQHDEVEAIQMIYPEEFTMISDVKVSDDGSNKYRYPIQYRFRIQPGTDTDQDEIEKLWPPHPVAIEIQYPYNYPSDVIPIIQTDIGKNNGIQFTSTQALAFHNCMKAAAEEEHGMPCVLSIIYAAQTYFQTGQFHTIKQVSAVADDSTTRTERNTVAHVVTSKNQIPQFRSVSEERKMQCILEGLEIANSILLDDTVSQSDDMSSLSNTSSSTKGGTWSFTIGLVGKPSAGKSTFFNAATAFARQRRKEGEDDNNHKTDQDAAAAAMAQLQLGGASMAPHPFTTIDPNIGYCLVPAPNGSCPEDTYHGSYASNSAGPGLQFGNTHGRDNNGRRLVPVLLKDVAGLVPGAYEGRGRGNQFLNDLCDADVLVHVVDSSGMADSEGNIIGVVDSTTPDVNDQSLVQVPGGGSHPLNDMSWIRNELVQWVVTNLMYKWETIRRRGRGKLSDMFSGYGQPQATTWRILDAVESFLEMKEKRDRALDNLPEWDEGDVHRLVSTFLAVRFPIALALNKCDLPTSKKHVADILSSLPIHGTLVGTPVSAKQEMLFMKYHIEKLLGIATTHSKDQEPTSDDRPSGTWTCLQSALSIRDVVLVFPVSDFTTYNPMPGLTKCMISDSSLPSPGMIACLEAAGGSKPTLWDPMLKQYMAVSTKGSSGVAMNASLRDAIMIKSGSTVEDVFVVLKRMGGLSGEFVRAEGTSDIGVPAKPIPKTTIVTKKIRIMKIMTNKRASWQKV